MSHDHGGATNTNPASQSRTSQPKTHKLSFSEQYFFYYFVYYFFEREVVNEVVRVVFACATADPEQSSLPNPSHSPPVLERGWGVSGSAVAQAKTVSAEERTVN